MNELMNGNGERKEQGKGKENGGVLDDRGG